MQDNLLQLSIVIVNYNGRRFLEECITSIRQFVFSSHEVIIVDNASSDGSADYIEAHFPEVRLIRSANNSGFTGGNNLGVQAARGELVLLLNNDTQLLTSIDPALTEFKNTKLGALGAHLFYGDGRNQPSVGYTHTPLRILLSWVGLSKFRWLPSIFRRTEYAPEFYDTRHDDVAWVSGAFLLTRRDLWQAIGGLDERYFMYVEDVDYCKQVRDLGFKVIYIPSVKVVHYEGGGKEWIGQGALTRTVRSYSIYVEKHFGRTIAILTGAFLSLVMGLRVPFYFFRFKYSKSTIDSEKAQAYAAAARIAFINQK